MDSQKRRTTPTKTAQGIWQSVKRWAFQGEVLVSASVIGILAAASYAWAIGPRHVEPPAVAGDFRTRSYVVSDHEHVAVFDLPNRVFPTRCWIYVNEATKTSNMQCDPNDDSGGLPVQGPELSR